MITDNSVRHREAESGSFSGRLGGEERLEDLGLNLRRNPRPGVRNTDLDLAIRHTRGDRDLAAVRLHRLLRIDHQVHDDLLELVCISHDPRNRLESFFDRHLVDRQLVVDDRH